MKQRYKLCRKPSELSFNVKDEVWQAVAGKYRNNVLCLNCFDYLASSKSISLANALDNEMYYAGDCLALTLQIRSKSDAVFEG